MTASSELRTALSVVEPSLMDAILGTTRSIAMIADADGTILRVSPDSVALGGWEPQDLEGLTLGQWLAKLKPSDPHGALLMEQEIPVVRALSGEHVTAMKMTCSHRNGELIPLTVEAVPLTGSDGRVIGAITAITDLRKYERLEHKLRASFDELARHVRKLAAS